MAIPIARAFGRRIRSIELPATLEGGPVYDVSCIASVAGVRKAAGRVLMPPEISRGAQPPAECAPDPHRTDASLRFCSSAPRRRSGVGIRFGRARSRHLFVLCLLAVVISGSVSIAQGDPGSYVGGSITQEGRKAGRGGALPSSGGKMLGDPCFPVLVQQSLSAACWTVA